MITLILDNMFMFYYASKCIKPNPFLSYICTAHVCEIYEYYLFKQITLNLGSFFSFILILFPYLYNRTSIHSILPLACKTSTTVIEVVYKKLHNLAFRNNVEPGKPLYPYSPIRICSEQSHVRYF